MVLVIFERYYIHIVVYFEKDIILCTYIHSVHGKFSLFDSGCRSGLVSFPKVNKLNSIDWNERVLLLIRAYYFWVLLQQKRIKFPNEMHMDGNVDCMCHF